MKKLRLGLIGLGSAGIVQYHAAKSVREVEFVAGAESGEVRERVDIPVHKDWRRLIEDSSLDAVSIALPHHLHLEVARAAFDTGKHVLLEKPIARNAAEAHKILKAARAAQRVLMIEMTHRFYPPVRAGHDLVHSRRLGQIYAVEERIIECGAAGRLPKWLTTTKLAGGGVALTNGIHMLDRVAWVCGQPLRFHDGVASWSQKIGDIEDTAAMQLTLSDGTPVHFLASWPRRDGRIDDELTVYGTKGTLRIWAWRGWQFEPTEGEPEEHRSYKKGIVPAMIGMGGALREFAAAITERRKPSPSTEEILAAHEIIDQFYKRVRKQP